MSASSTPADAPPGAVRAPASGRSTRRAAGPGRGPGEPPSPPPCPPRRGADTRQVFGYVAYAGLRDGSGSSPAPPPTPATRPPSAAEEGRGVKSTHMGLFPLLGVRPALGRFFNARTTAPAPPPRGRPRRAIWRRVSAPTRVLGQKGVLDGSPCTVVAWWRKRAPASSGPRATGMPMSLRGPNVSEDWQTTLNGQWLAWWGGRRAAPATEGPTMRRRDTPIYRPEDDSQMPAHILPCGSTARGVERWRGSPSTRWWSVAGSLLVAGATTPTVWRGRCGAARGGGAIAIGSTALAWCGMLLAQSMIPRRHRRRAAGEVPRPHDGALDAVPKSSGARAPWTSDVASPSRDSRHRPAGGVCSNAGAPRATSDGLAAACGREAAAHRAWHACPSTSRLLVCCWSAGVPAQLAHAARSTRIERSGARSVHARRARWRRSAPRPPSPSRPRRDSTRRPSRVHGASGVEAEPSPSHTFSPASPSAAGCPVDGAPASPARGPRQAVTSRYFDPSGAGHARPPRDGDHGWQRRGRSSAAPWRECWAPLTPSALPAGGDASRCPARASSPSSDAHRALVRAAAMQYYALRAGGASAVAPLVRPATSDGDGSAAASPARHRLQSPASKRAAGELLEPEISPGAWRDADRPLRWGALRIAAVGL